VRHGVPLLALRRTLRPSRLCRARLRCAWEVGLPPDTH
jgi:hypothetical protein